MPWPMLLTLTTTHRPATDLGYLLHKNPTKLQTFELAFKAYPKEVTVERLLGGCARSRSPGATLSASEGQAR